MTTSCSDTMKTEERSHFLRVKEQRTMLLLFSSLRFELCNSIQDSSRPLTQPQTGRHTKSIVQTVHLDSAPTGSHFLLLVACFLTFILFCVFSLCAFEPRSNLSSSCCKSCFCQLKLVLVFRCRA